MLTTLSVIVLMTGSLLGTSPQPSAQPCSFIVGGFLNEPQSPKAAIQQARISIWNVYQQHVATCIDLRIFGREGAVMNIVFRSNQRNGSWKAAILNSARPTQSQQRPGSTQYKDVQAIELVKPCSGMRLSNNALPKASEYNLLFRLKDGTTLEL
jgi:hypothetical protein